MGKRNRELIQNIEYHDTKTTTALRFYAHYPKVLDLNSSKMAEWLRKLRAMHSITVKFYMVTEYS